MGWGEVTLVTAAKLLLRAALEDPLNQHFQLLCEKSLPLYSPAVVYNQLMLRNLTLVAACPHNVRVTALQGPSLGIHVPMESSTLCRSVIIEQLFAVERLAYSSS